jgi:chromosome segregation ATPase
MEGMFGKQLSNMNDVLQMTAQSIQAASQRFDSLSEKMQTAGTGAVESMGKRMEEMLQSMQARQSESNAQMSAFVAQLKETVSQSQSEGSVQLRAMLATLAETAGDLIKRLETQSHTAQDDHAKRQAALAHHTGELIGKQREQVHQLASVVQDAAGEMRSAVEQMKLSTTSTVESMKVGAASLHGAAERLTSNLNEMREASDGLGEMAQKLSGSAQTLSAATNAAVQALADQRAVRDALATMVSELRSVVENAKREAGMTQTLVAGLQSAAQRLSEAQVAADSYLQGVSEVLSEAHAAFAREVEGTLRKGNSEFHKQLSDAVGILRGAIQEIGDVVDSLPERA